MANSRKSNLADIRCGAPRAAASQAQSHPGRLERRHRFGRAAASAAHLCAAFRWRLSALHVHHGISPNADAWADFCAELCARHDIPLHGRARRYRSAARRARHRGGCAPTAPCRACAAIAAISLRWPIIATTRPKPCCCNCCAAQASGAAAMPLLKAGRDRAHAMLRPLLDISRVPSCSTMRSNMSLRWVEDESNADDSYPRNFLRHRVLPLLEQRFPAYRDTLSAQRAPLCRGRRTCSMNWRSRMRRAVVVRRRS